MYDAIKQTADVDKTDIKYLKQERIKFIITANRDFSLSKNFTAEDVLEEVANEITQELRAVRQG